MLRILSSRKDPPSDRELLDGFRDSGNQALLGELYGRYLELVYGLCLKYLASEADAEDAVMSIYEELITKVRKHEIENFRSWLYVLAKNFCLMKLRRDKKNLTVAYEPGLMQSVDSRHHIIEIEEDNGQMDHLRDCLQELNEQQKQCIELFYLQGHSYKEVAEMCDEKVGTVRSYIQNGRRNLRNCMDKKTDNQALNAREKEE